MATKIDTAKLEEKILSLKALQKEWKNVTDKTIDQGDNCGLCIVEILNVKNTLENMQSSFVTLIDNTILYMEQRKASVDTKEEMATQNLLK